MKKKNLTALILLAAMLVSCGSGTGTSDTTEGVTGGETSAAEVTTEENDGLPDKQLDGFELRFYNFNKEWFVWAENQLDSEAETGEVLNDAIYRRNRKIEERFDAKIVETTVRDTRAEIGNIVMSGDDLYDVVMLYDMNVASIFSNDIIIPWNGTPYINFGKPWWDLNANSVFSVNGEQYAAVGDFSMSMRSRNYLWIMNKTMYSEVGDTSDIYKLVYDGDWTYDKFLSIAKDFVNDTNGDGKMDENDRYGVTSAVKLYYQAMFSSAGCRYIDTDKNGELHFTLASDTRAVDVLGRLFELNTGDIYYPAATDIHTTNFDFFLNRHALFIATSTAYISRFRDFSDDIAFLPVPKYEADQDEYRSLSAGGTVAALPATVTDERKENIGLLLEALSFESNKSVLPAYYESTLKGKFARDDDSVKMLDIILGSSFYDLGVSVFPNETLHPIMQNVFMTMSNTLASTIAGMTSNVEAKIAEVTQKNAK